jgi:heme-degrading monooxygenase HmoA
MPQLYTSAERVVRPGREAEFVTAWRDLTKWTFQEVEGNSRALLLRDRWNLRRFVSLGGWDSLEAIQRWRADPGFQMRNARIRALTESYEPSTFEQVLELERGS